MDPAQLSHAINNPEFKEPPRGHVHVEVHEFRRVCQWLRAYSESRFPRDSVVRVDNPKFKGYGVVVAHDECPPDCLPVVVESGNAWFYELETISFREPRINRWPRWIRDLKLRQKLRRQRLLRNVDEVEP